MTASEANTFSQFGGLWSDRHDAPAEVRRRRSLGNIDDAEAFEGRDNERLFGLVGCYPSRDCRAFADDVATVWRDGASDVLLQARGEQGGRVGHYLRAC
jgi:hypothetical protein